jgi:hypothetical protein
MRDDWKPEHKGGFPGGVRRTVRDRKGNPWHYDHNKKEWVPGMWKSSAELKPENKRKEQSNDK